MIKKTLQLAAFAAFACLPLIAAAQETAPAQGGVKKETFIDVLKKGGWVMYPIGIASVGVLWLTVDVWMRTGKDKMTPPIDTETAQGAFRAGDYVGAYQAMKGAVSPFAQVVRAGLGSVGYGKSATEEAILSEVERVNSVIQTRINYLSVIGVCTPMIGLLGTVSGMMGAFAELGSSGIGDPSALSEHIGEVLVATASGLFIAIPAFMFFYFLRNKLQVSIHHLEEEVVRLFRNTPYEYLRDADVGQEETYAALPNWIEGGEVAQ